MGPGGALPSEAELATEYGTSRVTVRRARSTCCGRRGSSRAGGARAGSSRSIRCASRSVGSPRSKPRSKPPARLRAARSSRSGSSARRPPAAAALRTSAGTDVLRVERLNLADDRPVRARRRVGARRSRRRPLARRRRARTVLRPVAAARRRSSAPCTRRSAPRSPTVRPRVRSTPNPASALLVARRVTCDTDGAPVLYSEHRYPADRTTFEIEFSLNAGVLEHV